jgi:Fic-DOC domain mobile mystery protein B
MFLEFPEGATPLHDASELLISWVLTMGDLNRVEAENILQAQERYLRVTPSTGWQWFQYGEFQKIHRAMFGKVWAWAGRQRKESTSIGVKTWLIGTRIAELCEEVISWANSPIELSFVEKSARIHHRLVFIHPFENGNGRFSRLVADRCLLVWGCPYPKWPSNLSCNGSIRKRYISSLQEADRGNYEALVLLMKELGAADPGLEILFQKPRLRDDLKGAVGVAKLKALLRQGGNPNAATENGHRVLQLILKHVPDNGTRLAFLKLCIDYGAAIDDVDRSGLTPYQVAVDIGDRECALFLRSQGARPVAPPGSGNAKHYAMFPE